MFFDLIYLKGNILQGQSDWAKEFPEDLETRENQSRTDECVSTDNSDSSKVEVALVCKLMLTPRNLATGSKSIWHQLDIRN